MVAPALDRPDGACRRGQAAVIRHRVRRAALSARHRLHALRDYSLAQGDRVLEQRWALWASGWLPEPPAYVPRAWEGGQGREAALAGAAAECRRTAAALLLMVDAARDDLPSSAAKRVPLVIALCEVAADHVEDDSGTARPLLTATARALDLLEVSLADVERNELGTAVGVLGSTTAAVVRRALARLDLEPYGVGV